MERCWCECDLFVAKETTVEVSLLLLPDFEHLARLSLSFSTNIRRRESECQKKIPVIYLDVCRNPRIVIYDGLLFTLEQTSASQE